jgi:hypothetical protein
MAHSQRSHSISSNKPHCSSRPPLRHRRAIRASQPDRVLAASCRQNLQLNALVQHPLSCANFDPPAIEIEENSLNGISRTASSRS